LVRINGLGIIFVVYSLYLAIVINIEIRIDKMISVFDIRSIEDISVKLFIVVYGGIKSIFIINITIIGIKICQYIPKLISSGIDINVKIESSIY
jgi:hypothetical protein